MPNMNRGTLSGRIYSLRMGSFNDTKVANFSIRQYKKFTDGTEKVDFIPLEAWGPVAGFIEKIYQKGLFAVVEYKVKTKKDKETGYQVIALQVESIDPQPVGKAPESHNPDKDHGDEVPEFDDEVF